MASTCLSPWTIELLLEKNIICNGHNFEVLEIIKDWCWICSFDFFLRFWYSFLIMYFLLYSWDRHINLFVQVQNLVLEVLLANLMVSQSVRATVSQFCPLLWHHFCLKLKFFLALYLCFPPTFLVKTSVHGNLVVFEGSQRATIFSFLILGNQPWNYWKPGLSRTSHEKNSFYKWINWNNCGSIVFWWCSVFMWNLQVIFMFHLWLLFNFSGFGIIIFGVDLYMILKVILISCPIMLYTVCVIVIFSIASCIFLAWQGNIWPWNLFLLLLL